MGLDWKVRDCFVLNSHSCVYNFFYVSYVVHTTTHHTTPLDRLGNTLWEEELGARS